MDNFTSRLAVQAFSVNSLTSNQETTRATLHKIKKIGYNALETCNDPAEGMWQGYLQDAGLTCCSHHETAETVIHCREKIISKLKGMNCDTVVSAISLETNFDDEASMKRLVEGLNEAAEEYDKAGIRLLYHNHNMEFSKMENGMTCMEYMLRETSEKVGFQFEAFWAQLAGADPVAWCRRLGSRLRSLHLKDCGVSRHVEGEFRRKPVCTELGRGNMELSALLAQAAENGCEWYVLEAQDNWIHGDPLKSIAYSYRYLQEFNKKAEEEEEEK